LDPDSTHLRIPISELYPNPDSLIIAIFDNNAGSGSKYANNANVAGGENDIINDVGNFPKVIISTKNIVKHINARFITTNNKMIRIKNDIKSLNSKINQMMQIMQIFAARSLSRHLRRLRDFARIFRPELPVGNFQPEQPAQLTQPAQAQVEQSRPAERYSSRSFRSVYSGPTYSIFRRNESGKINYDTLTSKYYITEQEERVREIWPDLVVASEAATFGYCQDKNKISIPAHLKLIIVDKDVFGKLREI
jgi:hypothetical protein